MTQGASVDRDQLAVLRRLRDHFGDVEVLEVRPSPELLPVAGKQAELRPVVPPGYPPAKRERVCSCHASDLYASLRRCPGCKHRSYDPIAQSCERRRCAYEGPLTEE